MRKLATRIFLLIVHVLPFAIIYYYWKPFSNWFLSKVPSLGVDMYLSVTYVAYHLRNFSLPFNSFKDFWFAGYPLMSDHPQLSFYLMLPFAAFFGLPVGVQIYAMVMLLLAAIFSYLLFFQLSKNHGLSVFLSVLVLLSPNIYGAAIWAGSLPYFGSQAIFPLGLFFGAKYLEKPSARNLATMSLVTGIGILIHPLSMLAFLIPSLMLVVIMRFSAMKFEPLKSVKHSVLFLGAMILASFSYTADYVIGRLITFSLPTDILPSASRSASGGASSQITQFYKDQIKLVYTQTNELLFTLAALGLLLLSIAFLFSKHKKNAVITLTFILIAAYTLAHPAVNLGGVFSFFRHDPYRAFWAFPIALGALVAASWGFVISTVFGVLNSRLFLKAFKIVLSLAISAFFISFSYLLYRQEFDGVIKVLDSKSEYSSAFPEALNIHTDQKDLETVTKQIIPSFMDPNDRNMRLYSADATVNIWWNSFFTMPQARGYIDPPIGTDVRGGLFWLDIAIANDSLVRDFKIDENTAFNNALFLIDWNGIGYFEGGRLSSTGPNPGPSSYLVRNNVFEAEEEVTTYGAVLKYQTPSGKPELHRELPQHLKFYKVADKFTSPILAPTDASVIAVFSSFAGYEDVLRILGSVNLNSRKIIPVYAGEYIDRLKFSELKNFDALFAYQYKTHNSKKAFSQLEKYINEGGKVFIDTGAESKESNSSSLPDVFPFSSSTRSGLGKEWNLTQEPNLLMEGVDTSQFAPPIFNEDEWKLSVPKDSSKLKERSTVLLKHRGKPLLIERGLGSGRIVWSGLNLPYHYNQYKNESEAKLFLNILASFVNLDQKEQMPFSASWKKPEKVVIKTSGKPKGILFKEEGYSGWSVRLTSENGKKLPIYLAGPTFPGFMYVPLSDAKNSQVTLTFDFSGSLKSWVIGLVNLLAIVFLLDVIVFNGFSAKKLGAIFRLRVRKKVNIWWEKEDE